MCFGFSFSVVNSLDKWTFSAERSKYYPWTETTVASYQNESSDSVSRKPVDGFKNAFNTKIDLFDATFVTTILMNTTKFATIDKLKPIVMLVSFWNVSQHFDIYR